MNNRSLCTAPFVVDPRLLFRLEVRWIKRGGKMLPIRALGWNVSGSRSWKGIAGQWQNYCHGQCTTLSNRNAHSSSSRSDCSVGSKEKQLLWTELNKVEYYRMYIKKTASNERICRVVCPTRARQLYCFLSIHRDVSYGKEQKNRQQNLLPTAERLRLFFSESDSVNEAGWLFTCKVGAWDYFSYDNGVLLIWKAFFSFP